MKKMKRTAALFLCLALVCSLLPSVSLNAHAETYSGNCGENLTWTFDTQTGLLTISGYGPMTEYDSSEDIRWQDFREEISAVSLPDGLTNIGTSAFSGCTSLGSVIIPDSVTGIGDWAFDACSALTSVTIGNGVTSIGDYAFCDCSSLTGVTIPDSVTDIGDRAFFYCSALTNVTIGDGVIRVGRSAFSYCSALTGVTIPDSVTNIGDYAFFGCTSLGSVTIPASVTIMGNYVFVGCTSLSEMIVDPCNPNYIGVNGVLYNKAQTELIQYPAGKPGASYQIPDGVTGIGPCAFYDCSNLTGVTIPSSITSIGAHAFYDCSNLTGVTITDNVTSIGDWAFEGCYALESVIVPASVISIGEGAFGYRWDDESREDVKLDYFTVCGYPGTAAETYATENGFRFVAADRFVDVTGENYFFRPVMWAISQNPEITSGVDDTHFGPNNDCTREQIVTFLWAANGKPEPAGTETAFSDVASDAWYYKPVMWAVENGYTSGMSDGSFGVGQPCTRAQAMTFLWAAKGKPAPSSMESTFSDVSSGDWFCKAILWAAENGITKGIGNGLFGVNDTCTRAQIITFLYKAYN